MYNVPHNLRKVYCYWWYYKFYRFLTLSYNHADNFSECSISDSCGHSFGSTRNIFTCFYRDTGSWWLDCWLFITAILWSCTICTLLGTLTLTANDVDSKNSFTWHCSHIIVHWSPRLHWHVFHTFTSKKRLCDAQRTPPTKKCHKFRNSFK